MRIKFWIQEAGWGILVAVLVFGAAFLCDARRQLMNAINDQDAETNWIVLVSDEGKLTQIAAVLENLEGVKNVELVTQEMAYQQFLSEPSLRSPLKALNANPFRSYYKVGWDLRKTKPKDIESQARTVRQQPGVGSVNDRSTQIKIAHQLYLSLTQINSVLLGGLIGLTVFSLLWAGTHLDDFKLDSKTLLRTTLWDGGFGVTAYFVAGIFLETHFLPLLGLGFLAGLVRSSRMGVESAKQAETPPPAPESLPSEIL